MNLGDSGVCEPATSDIEFLIVMASTNKRVTRSQQLSIKNAQTSASKARLSTSSKPSTPTVQKLTTEQRINAIEARYKSLETSCNQLISENAEFKRIIENLQSELTETKRQSEQLRLELDELKNEESSDLKKVSRSQEELNSNIIIRGAEVNENTPESELLAVYEGIRNYLDISGASEFDPVSVSLIPRRAATGTPSSETNKSSSRPIQVKLASSQSKKKFLQVRRIKKDIFPADIGIINSTRRPILISEHLTRSNQELLFQARGLRGHNGFKFVWSSDGQILVRHKPNTKVIRIIDVSQIQQLKDQFNILSENGRYSSGTPQQHCSSD